MIGLALLLLLPTPTIWFSLDYKLYASDYDSDSVVSENQPLAFHAHVLRGSTRVPAPQTNPQERLRWGPMWSVRCLKDLKDTVFIRISAQPRISAHLEWAPLLKAEKLTSAQTRISAHPTPLPPTKTPMRDNKRHSRIRSFLQGILQEPCFVTSSLFVISIYCFVSKYTTTLAENGENLMSAQPRISARLE